MIKAMKDFQIPMRVEVDKDAHSPTFGRFTTEAFERGFGTTIGNALRRILLSSLTGAAVTTVKIEGVVHEFSTISGVTEDVTAIIGCANAFVAVMAVLPKCMPRRTLNSSP